MKSKTGHVQFLVKPENVPFYADLFSFLGWNTIWSGDEGIGVVEENGVSFWFMTGATGVVNDYDGPGVNHIAIAAESQADVDAASKKLTEDGIAMLFETPRHRPDFAQSETETYYQIMFETPDRFLLEYVYTGPK
jgi:catechol 2,3-dioxygenase-like lactoylglutathione lyase family enzyme